MYGSVPLSRRHFLIGAGAAAIASSAPPAYARQQDVDYEIRQFTAGAPISMGRVHLDLPEHSDAGTVVPMTVSVDSPMTADDYPVAVRIFATENPRPRVMTAYFTPLSGKAEVSTRIRLDGVQTVTAIARMTDGTFWRADKRISVTFGACLNAAPGAAHDDDFVPRARVDVPANPGPGEIVTVRTVITHPMDTGFQVDLLNQFIPVRIIEQLTCRFLGEEVIRIQLEPAISTNPYFSFFMRASGLGRLQFEWVDTNGAVYTESALISPRSGS